MKKIVILHLAMLALLIAVGLLAYNRYWNVAVANGVPISRVDYIKLMEKQGGKQTLALMVDDALILNEGRVKGVKIDQKAIDEEIAKIETRLKGQNETLDSALKAAGMTRDDLVGQIKIRQIQDTLSTPKTEITQTAIDEFLKTNKDRLPTGKTKAELQTLAKDQLALEASQSAASEWLDGLRKSAKIIYK